MSHNEYENFDPLAYLTEYYQNIGEENAFLLQQLAHAYREFKDDSLSILEVGGGPTIYQLISAAPKAKIIHFTDYSQANLAEVSRWLQGSSQAFDWRSYIEYAIKAEGAQKLDTIKNRETKLKSKIKTLTVFDILNNRAQKSINTNYDLVSSIFSSDAITHSLAEWENVLKNMLNLVKPSGYLLLVGVFGSKGWISGSSSFVATNLNEDIVKSTLKKNHLKIIRFAKIDSETHGKQGYDGVFFSLSQKSI